MLLTLAFLSGLFGGSDDDKKKKEMQKKELNRKTESWLDTMDDLDDWDLIDSK